jgi:YidC/Oxa1 family membrane protein insertase
MEKRFLLAFGLSLLVLMVYSAIMPKPKPIVNKYVADNSTTISGAAVVEKTENNPHGSVTYDNLKLLDKNNLYEYQSDGLGLTFSKLGGFLLEVYDKQNNTHLPIKNIGYIKEWADYPFQATEVQSGIVFEYKLPDGAGIKKAFYVKSEHTLDLTITIYNINNSKISSYNIFVGYFNPSTVDSALSQRYYESSLFIKDTVLRKPVHGLRKAFSYEGDITWAGLRDRYFCVIFFPQLTVNKGVIDILNNNSYLQLDIPERGVSGKNSIEDTFKIYIGPQNEQYLRDFGSDTARIINFGTFDTISKVLLFLLVNIHKGTNNWGWAIIFVTILIYFILFPLSYKSMLSMKKMQALQPKIEEIRKKCKDNPQKLQMETMELYKREKVNPFGGCLPMLLQIPVFFALYQLLVRFISLKGAPFLWIKDLSEPDRLFLLSSNVPIVGNEINILPILMAATMFVQQKLSSPKNATDSVAEQQKMMMIIMPVLFGFLFYKMSSGLVLYWFVNSLLMLGFQWKISKIKI